MTQQLGDRLVVVDVTATCDTRHEHQSRIITDGHTAYAAGIGPIGVDHGPGWRESDTVFFTCQQPDRYDEPCGGTIEVPLTGWTGDVQAIEVLTAYGQEVDQ